MASADNKRQTALITGASAGLGQEFARLFAADGVDVVLVARRLDRLEQLAESIGAEHGVNATPLAEDLSDPKAPDRIVEALGDKGIEVDHLVNNAGFGSNGPFLEQDREGEASMIDVNVRALVKLTHLLVPPMVERGHGKVLNIASTAGFQPGPGMAVYFATKAFVISFSEALSHELASTGVTVTCHCPGATATEFAKQAGNDASRLFQRGSVAEPPAVALHAYGAMQGGRVLAVHGFSNWLGMQMVRCSPRALVRRVSAWVNGRA